MPNFENHPLYPGNAVPLFVAAGPLKVEADLAPYEEIEDAALVPVITLGGYTLSEWSGNATSENPDDFIYYPDKKMAGNCRGLPNDGREGLLRLKEPIKRLSDRGIKSIVQVTNLPHENPLEVIPELVEVAAYLKPTAIEVNLSCPNGLDEEGNLHPPICNDPLISREIMRTSRETVGDDVCLGAKDSPHVSSPFDMVDARAVRWLIDAINPYIDFLTGINTVGGQDFPELKCGGGKGGASGPAVARVGRRWLEIADDSVDSHVAILSCGGIDSQNIGMETAWRLENGAMLVGGAQEVYRTTPKDRGRLAIRWAQEYYSAV